MTFYWWSHWFWITLLSTFLIPISIVHTYPSHDITPEYKTETNSNNNDANKDRTMKAVTKLYQTTSKIIWATTLPPESREADDSLPQTRTKLINIPLILEQASSTDADNLELAAIEAADRSDSVDYEFKRSTDESEPNKTKDETEGTIPYLDAAKQQEQQHQQQEKIQNDSNTKESSLMDTTSREKSINSTRQEKELKDFSIGYNFSNLSSKTTSKNETMRITAVQNGSAISPSSSLSSSTPSQPQIVNNGHSPVEWLNSRTLTTPEHVTNEEETSSSMGQKVPFTLENVNKEDEILRAESEHRSRKSKVLTAEYNHINRFINFSTDSKNLLTRSASSAPYDYDDDEGNISSEALAIKRTYFLDASAISAICFTVFGICCSVGTLGIVLYRRRFLNKPQALSEPDSSVYIDDSTMRDNSDEMYSLDNDSFLNSLEAMTIQNYWTDTVKHTKL